MKNIKRLGLGLAVISTLGFVGCGSDDSSSGSTVNTGTFVDAPVQGLTYSTATQSGTTDDNGNYQYKNGETVTFKIGNLTLGSVSAKKTITPLTLSGDTHLNTIGTKAINIARILQSLDENASNSAIIVIPATLKDLNVTNIDLLSDADLGTILTQAQAKTSKTYTLKSSTNAKNEMKSFLQKYLFSGTYSGTSTFLTSQSSYSSAQCGGGATWTATINSTGTSLSGNISNGTTISASISGSSMSGSASSGASWSAIIDENGKVTGTYNYLSGGCVSTLTGTKN